MRLTLAAAALVVASGAALAQGTSPSTAPGTAPSTPPVATAPTATTPGTQTPGASVNTGPGTTSPSPSAVQTTNTTRRTGAAPVPGRNSFTMNQAARRITAAGYGRVTGLKKDNQGIWRGQAQKDGQPVSVSLDYQGNVTAQ